MQGQVNVLRRLERALRDRTPRSWTRRSVASMASCNVGSSVFWRLGVVSLLDPDEAHYAELTREMMRSRSWLVPLLDGLPYIDKPVLFHWLQALFIRILGKRSSRFGSRAPVQPWRSLGDPLGGRGIF